jgi:hypothetical protein
MLSSVKLHSFVLINKEIIMKPYLLFLLFIGLCSPLLAQVRLVGFSEYGEANQANAGGSIFEVNADGSDYQVIKNFEGNRLDGVFTLFLEPDNYIYGIVSTFGLQIEQKYLFKQSKTNADFKIIRSVSNNISYMAQGNDGFFYCCDQSSSIGANFIKISLDGQQLDTLFTLTGQCLGLEKSSDGKLVCIVKFINNQTKIVSFDVDGTNQQTIWTQDIAPNEFIYGNNLQTDTLGFVYWFTSNSLNNMCKSHIYKAKTDGSEFQILLSNGVDVDGNYPSYIVGKSGVVYISYKTQSGNSIYHLTQSDQIELVGNSYNDGSSPLMLLNKEGQLLTIMNEDTRFSCYKFLPGSTSPIFLDSLSKKINNALSLVADDNGNFYGCLNHIFPQKTKIIKWNLDNASQEIIHDFKTNLPIGSFPSYLFKGIDGYYYGIFKKGGDFNIGSIFKIKPDGTNLESIYSIKIALQDYEYINSLFQGSDGKLYVLNNKEIFRMNSDGTNYQPLHEHYGGNTNIAEGNDGKIYWYEKNKFWSMDKDGQNLSVLLVFTNTNASTWASLYRVASGDFICSFTFSGGNNFDDIHSLFLLSKEGITTSILGPNNPTYNILTTSNNFAYCSLGKINLTSLTLEPYISNQCPQYGFLPIIKASNDSIYGINTISGFEKTIFELDVIAQNCNTYTYSPHFNSFNNQLAFERTETTSTSIPQKENNLTLFPIPCGNFLNVTCPPDFQKIEWKITDITGKTLLKGIENGNFEVSTKYLPSGFYFLRLKDITGKSTSISKVFTKI